MNQGELTISFCRSEERDEDNMLCEMDVTLPPSTNDLDVSVFKMFIIHAVSFIGESILKEIPFNFSSRKRQ